MKKAIVFGGLLILTLLGFSYAFAQAGGGFDLSWFTIDGGGGISTGGDFSLSGTIGQPDAGVLSGPKPSEAVTKCHIAANSVIG